MPGNRPRLFWQLFPTYLFITLLALVAVGFFTARELRRFYLDRRATELESRARLAEIQLRDRLAGGIDAVEPLIREMGERSRTRITLILPDGKVVGDSEEDPRRMENHHGPDRPEIMAALERNVGADIRPSETLDREMMYIAVPMEIDGRVVAVVRTSLGLSAVEAGLNAITARIGTVMLIVAAGAVVLSLLVSRYITRPLEQMRRGAERYARGELNWRLEIPESAELGALAEAMNIMAADLDDRIQTVISQANELEAMLASMSEGVLAVDLDERVIKMNFAAGRMLGVPLENAQGRGLQEAVRHPDLQKLIAGILEDQASRQEEIVLREEEDRFVEAQGSVLRGSDGHCIGALVVLNEVTRLRFLEGIRREFVANVSHELRTPITSITGFVETLLDGAAEDPERLQRFLQIIRRQAERLNAIIEDLLSLSRVERGSGEDAIPREMAPVREVIEQAAQTCEVQRKEKHATVEIACDPDLEARFNPPLLEQALVNLIGNAIKYGDDGGRVRVEVEAIEHGRVEIRVADEGPGIERKHLARLFERFYRVDKARSRALGGTGLGLSIVKHIALAHGGTVEVRSAVGEGSTFLLRLPAN